MKLGNRFFAKGLLVLVLLLGLVYSSCKKEEAAEPEFVLEGQWRMKGFEPKLGAPINESFLYQLKGLSFEMLMDMSIFPDHSVEWPVEEKAGRWYHWTWQRSGDKVHLRIEGKDGNKEAPEPQKIAAEVEKAYGAEFVTRFALAYEILKDIELSIRDGQLAWPIALNVLAERMKALVSQSVGKGQQAVANTEATLAELEDKYYAADDVEKEAIAPKLSAAMKAHRKSRQYLAKLQGMLAVVKDAQFYLERQGVRGDEKSYFILERVGEPVRYGK